MRDAGMLHPRHFFPPRHFYTIYAIFTQFMRFLHDFTQFYVIFTRFYAIFVIFTLFFARHKFSIPGTKNYYAGLTVGPLL